MFKKILIANRGEIACRVIKTARKMGIATVAVYSEADAQALHVQMADEAVAIGPAASAESYLVIEKIVQACKDTGAEAVHPGYGFLSENSKFAQALDKAGIVFIGPNVEAIAAMGDKIESKKLADEAGVSTVPGYLGEIAEAEEALKIAKDIGYPVMIKASAGGGGKGMRVAYTDAEVKDGFASARNEARSSFGDDRVFIEKYVEEPRHIEIQVLGDTHGNVIYLGERECSIQRRHQKVIEEAPSPFIDPDTRKAMGEQAVALAQAVNYRSAGTVEFIMDKDKNFYFLEMNTRLQVEHPVTEEVTGIDLVEQMIRVANGEKLSIAQADVKLNGWAIEARVYAEDPARGFLPSIGRLVRYDQPDDQEGTRIDTGVYEGAEISMFYDPMIAKLVTYGKDRDTAIARMKTALNRYYVRGVQHNMDFLNDLMGHPRFVEGRLTTNFMAEEYPDGYDGGTPEGEAMEVIIAVAAVMHRREQERATRISGQLLHGAPPLPHDWVVQIDRKYHEVGLEGRDGAYQVTYDGKTTTLQSDWQPGDVLFSGSYGDTGIDVQVDRIGVKFRLAYDGLRTDVLVLSPRQAELAARMPLKEKPDLSGFLLSPMPGLLVRVAVEVGQDVKAGEELAVVEAMKMENVLRAERDGVVKAIPAEPGANLAVDEVIIEFE